MSRSAVRDAIRGRPTRGKRRATPTGRGGLLDLVLVVGLIAVVVARTPVGALGWYGVERLRGHGAELPRLTAYFDSGAAAPPSDGLTLLPPRDEHTLPEGALPEPWRTSARATLADPPDLVRARLGAEDPIAWLDRAYAETGDVEAALELLAIGPELRDRAIARARASGDPEPSRYPGYRRYLPQSAQRDADRVVQGTLALATALDLRWPLSADHRLTSRFGDRTSPFDGKRTFHNGVDLAAPVGTPVHAAQAGRAVVVGEDDRNGKYVVLEHGNGVRTAYAHLSAIDVARDASVGQGEVFARSGNSGRSTGPHLHYVVRIAGEPVDPQRFRR